MPTYEDSEVSKHGGKPIELYRFVGTYQNFYYTSGQRVVNFQAPDEDAPNDYLPLALKRSAFTSTTTDDSDGAEITVDLPVSTDLVAIYGFQISPPELVLTIFRGHTAGEFVQAWKGDVDNVSVVRGTATIRVPSKLASALSADFPNVYYQTPCNHTLYDPRCGIDFAAWSETAAIVGIDGKSITLDTLPPALDGNLIGGDAILTSGERRMIVAQVDEVITINYPFAGAEVGGSIVVAAGCDLAWAGDCLTRFDNTKRHGGFPFIPPKNIFADGIEPGKDVADEACLPAIFDGVYATLSIEITEPGDWSIHDANTATGFNFAAHYANTGGVHLNYINNIFPYTIDETNSPDPYDYLDGQLLWTATRTSSTTFVFECHYPINEIVPLSSSWHYKLVMGLSGAPRFKLRFTMIDGRSYSEDDVIVETTWTL
jgi:hypothetical protein